MVKTFKTGTELKTSMILLGYTNNQAAKAAGVTPQTWQRYCNGGKGYENGPPVAPVQRFLLHAATNYIVK